MACDMEIARAKKMKAAKALADVCEEEKVVKERHDAISQRATPLQERSVGLEGEMPHQNSPKRFRDEDDEVDAEVAQLERQIEDLQRRKKRHKTEEEEASRRMRALSSTVLYPHYWSLNHAAEEDEHPQYPELQDPAVKHFFQQLVKNCSHDCSHSSSGSLCPHSYLRDSQIVKIRRIENKLRWQAYRLKTESVRKALRLSSPSPLSPELLTSGVQDFFKCEKLDRSIGEAWLFHGVSSAKAAFDIGDRGFITHLAEPLSMFGSGCYFTDEFCKAAWYANKEDSGEAFVLVCRVCVGDPFLVTNEQPSRGATRPPRKCGCEHKCKCAVYYNSVVATLTVQGRGRHREIVMYEPDQVYPEFMLELRPTALKADPGSLLAAAASRHHSSFLAGPSFARQSVQARARPTWSGGYYPRLQAPKPMPPAPAITPKESECPG